MEVWKIEPSRKAVNDVTKNGNLESLKKLEKKYGFLPDQQIVNIAAEKGHLEVLKYLETKRILPDVIGANYALGTGKIEVLDWLASLGILPKWDLSYKIDALQNIMMDQDPNSVVKSLKWMDDHKLDCPDTGIYEGLIFNELFREFLGSGSSYFYGKNINPSMKLVIDWMLRQNVTFSEDAILFLAEKNFMDILLWLETKGITPIMDILESRDISIMLEDAVEFVNQSDCLRILQYYGKFGIFPDEDGVTILAGKGYLRAVEYLFDHDVLPNKETLKKAQKEGYTDIVKWINKYYGEYLS